MLPPDLLTTATLATAAWGAVLGFALGLVDWVIRDWPLIRHRLEKRLMIARGHANAHDWPDEPEGYAPNALSESERAAFPQTLLIMTISGALWMVAVDSDNQILQFLALAGASIFIVLRLLASDDAEEVGAATESETPATSRFRRIGAELVGIAILAVMVIEPVRRVVFDWVAHGPRVMVFGSAALAAVLAGVGLWRWWHSPERERTDFDLPKEAVIGFVGAIAIVGSILALAILA